MDINEDEQTNSAEYLLGQLHHYSELLADATEYDLTKGQVRKLDRIISNLLMISDYEKRPG